MFGVNDWLQKAGTTGKDTFVFTSIVISGMSD
jgi:hypothetical protein